MLIIDSRAKDLTAWIESFKKYIPLEEIVTWETCRDFSKVIAAVAWGHRKELFSSLPNLEWVASPGAGVDHIINDPLLPGDVAVTKVVSDRLKIPMSNFCIGAVMYFHKQFDKYSRDQKEKIWHQEHDPEIPVRIGILGFGELGRHLGKTLKGLGFQVHGISKKKKLVEGIVTYGMEDLDCFLSRINLLIGMLPLTHDTLGIYNDSFFSKLPLGSYFINVGRGRQQINSDVLKALDCGRLAGAFLDVFPKEPPTIDDPIWEHPKVFMTPHIAVVTKIEAAVPQISENFRRLKSGLSLKYCINRQKGY